MQADPSKVRGVIAEFLERAKTSDVLTEDAKNQPLTEDLHLYGGGLQLDSLETAELSALLEDAFGVDPFSAGGKMPETVGEILDFYKRG